jgi:hypothetical protein
VSVVIILGFVFPLVCWALAARTARVGWIIGTVLTLSVVAEIALANDWVLASAKITLLLVIVLATVTALIGGIAVEGRHVGVPKLRSAGARGALGLILSCVYCVVGLGVILLVAFLVVVNGPVASTPSSSEVLPLPAGLAVAGNRDDGCSSGSRTICSREIQVRSAAGLSDDEMVQQLGGHLAQTGWQLAPDTTGSWSGCRTEGWLLDGHKVCVDVQNDQGRVIVLLESSDSW